MNQEIINIELREQDAYININDGDYKIGLPKPIPILPNDIIEVKSCYIDSIEASQGDIVIEQDIQPTISFVKYITNWNAPGVPVRSSNITTDSQFDLKPYIACSKAIVPNMANVYAVGSMELFRESPSINGGKWGRQGEPPLTLKFQFREAGTGNLTIKDVPVPLQDGSKDTLIIDNSTNPNLFPWFIDGQPIDIINPTNPAITLMNQDNILASDNLDIGAILANNRAGLGRGRKTWLNIYEGNKFKKITAFTVVCKANSSGNGAKITVQFKSWLTGLLETTTFTINQSLQGPGNAVFTLLDPFQVVEGAIPVDQPTTDGTGTIKFIAPGELGGGDGDNILNDPPFNISTIFDDNVNFFMDNFTDTHMSASGIDTIANMLIEQVSFTLKAGKYPLSELCEILTDNFSSLRLNGNTFTNFPTNNKILQTNNQIRQTNNLGANDLQYYVRFDGKSFFTYNNTVSSTADPFIGSTQVAFVADQILNKVKIQAIHTPLLASGSSNIISKYEQVGNTGTSEIVGRNGGIIFTDLEPKSFWEDIGFSFDPDLCNFQKPSTVHSVISGQRFLTESIPIDVGRFTTDADTGLADAVLVANPYIFTGLSALNASVGNTSSNTNEIIAEESIAQSSVDNDGYFMIEISGIPQIETMGSKLQSSTIQSIISRYYQSGSFTSSYNEGSTPVIYKGSNPYMLSDLGVRILNARGELSNDVSNKSCVFLEIQRNIQN